MKIAGLEFKEYAAKKPCTITPSEDLITPSEVVKTASLGMGSLFALSEDLRAKLTIERNKLEPDYKLGIIGVGVVTKDEVTEHVEKRTDLGEEIVRAEMSYCNELMGSLVRGEVATMMPEIAPVELEAVPRDWKWIPKKWWEVWKWYFRNCVLFCEDTTDSLTKLAADYRIAKVHPIFKGRGFCRIVLQGINDVRVQFSPKAKSSRVVYISGVGHGSPTTYTGHLGDPILKKCNYDPKEVKGKIIHLLSCQTAKELGPDLVQKGAKAYAGYYENFNFVFDQPGTPINELELFWKCDSTFDIMMAIGNAVEAAHNTTIAAYNAAIASVPNTITATWLTWDRNYFRSPVIDAIYGDKTAKIYPYILMPVIPFAEAEEAIPQLAAE